MSWFFILAMAISGYFLFQNIYSIWYEKRIHRLQPDQDKVASQPPPGGDQNIIEKYTVILPNDLNNQFLYNICVAIDRINLGEKLKLQGEYKKAIAYLEQALARYKDELGEAHPLTVFVQNILAKSREQLVKTATK